MTGAGRPEGAPVDAPERGRAAEDRAALFLSDRGLVILGRNLRTGSGEIDILARDGLALVVVEVRLRAAHLAAAWRSVDAKKRDALHRCLREVARKMKLRPGLPLRMDLLLVDGRGTIRWVRSAFPPPTPWLIR